MKERIFGVEVNTEGFQEMLQMIFERLQAGQKSFIVAVNPEKLMKAREDEGLRGILNHASFQIPDGIGVVLASRLRKGAIEDRITGIDMMENLCKEAAIRGESVFLFGAKPGVAASAAAKLQEKYPKLKVAGILDGYVKDEEQVINTINASGASILFVAMGSPKQEHFIIENMKKLNISVFQGVGGSFDVFSGNIKRAPALFRKFGLEWFYRLLKEPSRWKRQLTLPRFLLAVIKEPRDRDGSPYE